MKVGEYVRTKNGKIGRFVNVEVYYVLGQNDKDKFSCVLFNNSCVCCIVSNDIIIKKGQPIDLIKVGDYVNGLKVDEIDEKGIYNYNFYDGWRVNIACCNEDIKSIVTKEQFSQMEYRIGE